MSPYCVPIKRLCEKDTPSWQAWSPDKDPLPYTAIRFYLRNIPNALYLSRYDRDLNDHERTPQNHSVPKKRQNPDSVRYAHTSRVKFEAHL